MYVEVVLLGARRALGDCTPKKALASCMAARLHDLELGLEGRRVTALNCSSASSSRY